MKTGIATKKIPGGKLLRVKTYWNENTKIVESVQLTGDFFLHPEEAIGSLENAFAGLPIESQRDFFLEKLHTVIRQAGAELVGFSAEDIVDTFLESLKSFPGFTVKSGSAS